MKTKNYWPLAWLILGFAEPGEGIMYADLPMKGISTFYSLIGDGLGWICVVGLLGLIPLSIDLRFDLKKEIAWEPKDRS